MRRIEHRAVHWQGFFKNESGGDNFVALIKKDKEVMNTFIAYLTINVSEFFRNREGR